MTEKEFWKEVNELQLRNRPKLIAAGVIKADSPKELHEAKRLHSSSVGCEELEDLPKDRIIELSRLLFKKNVSLKAKEMIIMTLAHESDRRALNILKKYNKKPEKELKYFAEFALQECKWWNE